MSSESGLNETAAEYAIDGIVDPDADVRLFTTALNYDDTASDLDTKEVSAADYTSVNVPITDWSIAFDNTNNEATVENAVEVDFGETENDWGTVVDVAIHQSGTDRFIIADEPNDPEITTGEQVSFPVGDITYTLGP